MIPYCPTKKNDHEFYYRAEYDEDIPATVSIHTSSSLSRAFSMIPYFKPNNSIPLPLKYYFDKKGLKYFFLMEFL